MKRVNAPFVIEFENGYTRTETRFSLHVLFSKNPDFDKYCNDKGESCKGIPFKTREATKLEIDKEKHRLELIDREFNKVKLHNRAIERGNRRVLASRNETEFMKAYR